MANSCLNIAAVGDICPGDKEIMGMGVMSKCRQNGPSEIFSKIATDLSKYDIVLGNLEGLLSEGVCLPPNPKALTFCGLPDFAKALANVGFNVLSLANNHSLEHGPEYLLETIAILQHVGIKICGLRDETHKFYSKPVFLERKKKIIGILAYNWVGVNKFPNSDHYIAQSHDSLVNYTWDRQLETLGNVDRHNRLVCNDIRKLKDEVDIVILMAHWGYEFVHVPPYGVVQEAHAFVEAGADVIIGSHPHVLQGEQRIGNSIVFYSLGNFIFDMSMLSTRFTSILSLKVGDYIDYHYIPYFINSNFQPEIATGEIESKISNILEMSRVSILSAFSSNLLDDDKIYRQYEDAYHKMKRHVIVAHFKALSKDLSILFLILKKIKNAICLLADKIMGKKVRW